MSDTSPNAPKSEKRAKREALKKEAIENVNGLKRKLVAGDPPKKIKEYRLLCVTSVAGLDRQTTALQAFRSSVDSIKGWDFVGNLPVKVVADLDSALNKVKLVRSKMGACELYLDQANGLVEHYTANEVPMKSVVRYYQQLTSADNQVTINLQNTAAAFDELKSQAEANSQACDAANKIISEFIVDTTNRSVILLQDTDIKYIDKGSEMCADAIETINQMVPEPLCDRCLAGIKFLSKLLTETLKEAVVQYKTIQMKSKPAFAQLGAYDIARAAAADTMRVIDIFLDEIGLVIPYWTYIKPGLKVFAEVYVASSVTRAEHLDQEKGGELTTFWAGFKEGLSSGFKAAAEDIKKQILDQAQKVLDNGAEIPEELITSTVTIVVKAFSEQVVARMPIEPAQKHPGVELQAYIQELKSSYIAGLQDLKPEVKQKVEALGFGREKI